MLSIPQWLARVGASLGVAIVVGAVAAPSPAAAAPGDEPFGFIAAQYEYRIGAVGAGGTVITPSVDGRNLEGARLRVDFAGLAGVATAEFPSGCVVTGTAATCPMPGDDEFMVWIPVFLKGMAAAGATGTIKWQLFAANLATQTETSRVTLADGPDLVFTGGSAAAPAKPDDVVSAPVRFFNNGTETVEGVQFWYSATRGIEVPQYANCVYENGAGICDLDIELKPGEGAVVGNGLPARIQPYGYRAESIDMAVFPIGANDAAVNRLKANGTRGTGGKLPVQKVTRTTAKAGPQDDVHSDDNYGSSIWNVANHYDVAALGGDSVGTNPSGAVGAEVKFRVGAQNYGPAWLAGPRSGDFGALSIKVTVPPGATVTDAPEACYGVVTENGQPVEKYDTPGLPEYYCQSAGSVMPGGGIAVQFTFKITEVITNATGTITTFRPAGTEDEEQGTLEGDTNAANNKATLVINPTTGGGGGGLPITGAKTGIAVGTGLALVVAGAVAVALARRRRILTLAE